VFANLDEPTPLALRAFQIVAAAQPEFPALLALAARYPVHG